MPDESRTAFLQGYHLSAEEFSKTGFDWEVLDAIKSRHIRMSPELGTTLGYVSERLQTVPDVHSLKVRVKDPEHLIAKIIRKKIESPKLIIDADTYEKKITDLAGVRALHLFKDDWQAIDSFVKETWKLHEKPFAYVRKGDDSEVLDDFKKAGLKIKEHPKGYRSVHYVIESHLANHLRLVEIQVRTIFEEGWSEIDHRVRYPHGSGHQILLLFLAIFNRLAGSADEMGSFTKSLDAQLKAFEANELVNAAQRASLQRTLDETISNLTISKEEKAKLEKQVAALRLPAQVRNSPSTVADVSKLSALFSSIQSNSELSKVLSDLSRRIETNPELSKALSIPSQIEANPELSKALSGLSRIETNPELSKALSNLKGIEIKLPATTAFLDLLAKIGAQKKQTKPPEKP